MPDTFCGVLSLPSLKVHCCRLSMRRSDGGGNDSLYLLFCSVIRIFAFLVDLIFHQSNFLAQFFYLALQV